MNLTAGTPLKNGKYVLNNLLGQSALGVTLKATQTQLNQAVVLKTLRSQPDSDIAPLRQQFLEETQRFSQCLHPGLVRVLDSFTEAGLPFAVMDYVAGQTLAEQVRSRASLPEAQVLQYIRQAGSALSVIHRQGLLHRDVKPQNLVRPQGTNFIVLVDFSIVPGALLTVPNRVEAMLANPYAAIELHQPQAALTAAADIYALAATLYFLVTRHAPIAASRRQQLPLVPPRQLQPHLSAAIEHAILSGMALDARDRPQTIAAWFSLLPDSNPLPAVQGFDRVNGEPSRAANDSPYANSISAGRPTAPPALPTLAHTTPAVAAPVATPPSSYAPMPAAPAPKSRLPKALGMTAAIAIAGGLGLGLALRVSAINGIGSTFFQTRQDFPPVENWPLQATSTDLPVTTNSPEPAPLLNVAPNRPLQRTTVQRPLQAPVTAAPSPTARTQATPAPLPSTNNPSASQPNVQPSSLPDPAVPTNAAPQPLPPVQPAANPSNDRLRQPEPSQYNKKSP